MAGVEPPPRQLGRAVAGVVAILVLALALPLQYAWFVPADLLSRYPQASDAVNHLCGIAGCRGWSLPDRRELIRMASRGVRVHPKYGGAL
ncbi:MAG: DUF3426 domain-containing protein [Gammaproteobacteria bacterium]|nr:DUF3426 domain-containing protein [Gammaproteobacteria bacterium]